MDSGGGILCGRDDECCQCVEVVFLSVCMYVRTCNKQCVHAWWRLGGLEHFANVLLRQRGLSSALSLGVLLLPPLEVLKGTRREKGGWHQWRGAGEKNKYK